MRLALVLLGVLAMEGCAAPRVWHVAKEPIQVAVDPAQVLVVGRQPSPFTARFANHGNPPHTAITIKELTVVVDEVAIIAVGIRDQEGWYQVAEEITPAAKPLVGPVATQVPESYVVTTYPRIASDWWRADKSLMVIGYILYLPAAIASGFRQQ